MIRDKFKTEKGMATYCGDICNYSVLIHVSPEPEGKENYSYGGEIDVIIATLGKPDKFLGSIPFDEVVGSKKLETECGINLNADDFTNIDGMCWEVLIGQYGIIPTEFVIPEVQ